MKVMTKRELDLYTRLIKLAGGDVSLVEQAIRQSASKEGRARLNDVMNSLQKRKDEETRAA